MEFKHLPDLGIVSDKRKELNSLKDYKELFEEYDKTTLVDNENQVHLLISYLNEKKRVAITCFEKEHCMCHRGRVSKRVSELAPRIPIKHL